MRREVNFSMSELFPLKTYLFPLFKHTSKIHKYYMLVNVLSGWGCSEQGNL